MHGKVVDECFTYTGDNGHRGQCRLRVLTADGQPPVLIASELDDNPGQSITNAAETMWPQAIAAYLPGWLDQADALTLIEHYPGYLDRAGRRREETFDLVSFKSFRPVLVYRAGVSYVTFKGPRWRHLARERVGALIGGDELVAFDT